MKNKDKSVVVQGDQFVDKLDLIASARGECDDRHEEEHSNDDGGDKHEDEEEGGDDDGGGEQDHEGLAGTEAVDQSVSVLWRKLIVCSCRWR